MPRLLPPVNYLIQEWKKFTLTKDHSVVTMLFPRAPKQAHDAENSYFTEVGDMEFKMEIKDCDCDSYDFTDMSMEESLMHLLYRYENLKKEEYTKKFFWYRGLPTLEYFYIPKRSALGKDRIMPDSQKGRIILSRKEHSEKHFFCHLSFYVDYLLKRVNDSGSLHNDLEITFNTFVDSFECRPDVFLKTKQVSGRVFSKTKSVFLMGREKILGF